MVSFFNRMTGFLGSQDTATSKVKAGGIDGGRQSGREGNLPATVTEKGIRESIDSLVASIAKSPKLNKFFSHDVKLLRELKERIGNVETRIAIIGITSSGKSTLMNAVLGAPLLPTRVGPSSSKQVLCGWDEKCEAEILFSPESGKQPRVLKGEDAIPKELEHYGDERFNPGNREEVDEIRVHAPGFRFDKNLVIIDTPGLDAYGLDQHKEVTMKLVLPTVDMVLFLTNVKCDSDAANLSFIDNVTTDDKPLVVVQNKIDSIEAKISRRGVEKTKEEVQQDHLRRLQRLLAGAKKASVRNAPIVQVSAKASNWRESNLGELGDILDKQIALNSRFRISRRARQFTRIVEEMIAALKPRLESAIRVADAQTAERSKFSRWQEHLNGLSRVWQSTEEEIRRRLTAIEQLRKSMLTAIEDKYARRSGFRSILGFDKVKSIDPAITRMKSEFEQKTRELNEFFSAAISRTQEQTKVCCSDLNLEFSQVLRSKPFRSTYVSIADCQTTRTEWRTRRVKQSGFWGGFKRFITLGCCGYDEEEYSVTVTEYDVEKFVEEIKKVSKTFFDALNQHLPVYQQSTEHAVDVLSATLQERRAAFQAQAKADVPVNEGRTLLAELEKLSRLYVGADVDSGVQNAQVAVKSAVSAFAESVVPKYVACAARLAHEQSFVTSSTLVGRIIRRSGARKAVICGWDREKMASMREWYFSDGAEVDVVDFSGASTLQPVPAEPVCVFCLVNAEQTGSFKGKLLGDARAKKWFDAVKSTGKIVWVMDSVREHVAADGGDDTLAEAFAEMMNLVEVSMRGEKVFEVMACDRDLYWTVLLHELYFNDRLFVSETAKQNFVNDMADLFRLPNDRRHATGSYVSQFQMLRKETKND